MKCWNCNTELTEEETKWYYDNATYCCDGRECGCMGQPTNLPFCNKCMEEGVRVDEND